LFSRDDLKGNILLIVLSSLVDGEKYGYEITKKVAGLTDGSIQLKEGSLYPALHKLEQQGLVEGHWVQQEPGKPDRKYYKITEDGLKAINSEKEKWKSYISIMERVLYGNGNT
jgi:Predicted transcriptional regulators